MKLTFEELKAVVSYAWHLLNRAIREFELRRPLSVFAPDMSGGAIAFPRISKSRPHEVEFCLKPRLRRALRIVFNHFDSLMLEEDRKGLYGDFIHRYGDEADRHTFGLCLWTMPIDRFAAEELADNIQLTKAVLLHLSSAITEGGRLMDDIHVYTGGEEEEEK